MQRWDSETGEKIEDAKVDAFLEELVGVCKRHDMCLCATNHAGGPSFKVYPQAYSSALNDLMNSNRAGERVAR